MRLSALWLSWVVLAGMARMTLVTTAQAQEENRTEPADVVAPRLEVGGTAPYPEGGAGDASVVLKVLVSETGSVEKVTVTSGDPPFSEAAAQAASTFRFSPATVEGEPRAAYVMLRIEFTAPVEEPIAPPAPAKAGEGGGAQNPEATPAEVEVAVHGVRRPGTGRVMSDELSSVIPGAEGDPVRAIESMPGVVPILASGPFLGLRGAGAGMVGYEYDGIAVPYLYHLGRGTSVLHPWLVESASLHPTGGPAHLGRAGGGFLEATAAPPEGKARASYRVRATDSALGVELPFAGGRGSFMAAGRYSYTAGLVGLVAPDFSLDFWDYQGRLSYETAPGKKVEILALGSGDHSAQRQDDGTMLDLAHTSFHRGALRYEQRDTSGAWHRQSVTLAHDRWDSNQSDYRPNSLMGTLRVEGQVPVSSRTWLGYGSDVQLREQNDSYERPDMAELANYVRHDANFAVWGELTGAVDERLTYALGLRADLFTSSATPVTPSAVEGSFGPRAQLSYELSEWARLHQSFGLGSQPRSPSQRPPGRVFSAAGGLEWTALADVGVELKLPWELTLDTTVFETAFFHVGDAETVHYLEGQPPGLDRAQGQAYGLELALQRTLARRLRGFISYTLSRSTRSIGRVSAPSQYDRTHVFDIALAYDFGHGFGLSSRATYYTGFPARVDATTELATAPRSSPYFQLDWQLGKRFDLDQRGRFITVTLGVLNTTLSKEANDLFCTSSGCMENLVGPATIPTIGVEGEI